MSKGYPDYFGFSMFPSYGSIYSTRSFDAAVSNGNSTILFNESFKGIIQGGFVKTVGRSPFGAVGFLLGIDGLDFYISDSVELFDNNTTNNNNFPLFFTRVDSENCIYTWGISRGMPINNNITLTVSNFAVNDISVEGILMYSIIET